MVWKRHVKRLSNFALHKTLHECPRQVGTADLDEFDEIFGCYGDEEIFAHVGLSDVNRALPGNPYTRVREVLDRNFDSTLVPGFTDYFRTSGVYSKQHSRPMYGTFYPLFLADADYRTDDACKSILVRGEYRFDGRDHHDTFSPNGCFAQLSDDDVLITSIGTPWLMCSFLHYLEAKNDVSYVYEDSYEGMLFDEGESYRIEQKSQYWDGYWRFNKLKLHRHWRAHGLIDEYDLNGLRVFLASAAEIDDFVSDKLQSEPHYLVT